MKKISLENYQTDKYYARIVKAVGAELAGQNFVTPIGVLISMGLLEKQDIDHWRKGRIPYIEQVVKCNLAKAGRILRILRFHAHDLNLKPSIGVYMRKTAGEKIPLRFSKTGERHIEEAYSRHFVRVGKTTLVDAPSGDQPSDAR